MTAKQRWLVGIDVRHRSDGAVRFGAWLHAQAPATVELVGVHVLEPEEFAPVRTHEQLKFITEQTLEQAGARSAFVGFDVVEADQPVMALEEAQQAEATRGIIIGRRAAGDSPALIRLGSVARRLLRRLVAPIFVVPPDLDVGRLGAGPIVVAITPDEPSVGAVKVAQALSTVLHRSLVFVRAVSTPTTYITLDRVDPAIEERTAQKVHAAEALTQAWLLERGVTGRLIVRHGDELSQILATAADLSAPFLVCGSRLMGVAGRVFGLSVSSELAADATMPVLVVPSDAEV